MSTFRTEKSSQDSLIYSVSVGKKSDGAKSDERVINRKVFTTNVENIQTYLSELNLDRIAENVLPDAEASECIWIFQTSGMSPAFAPAAWALAGFPGSTIEDVNEIKKQAFKMRSTSERTSSQSNRSSASKARRD